MRSLSIFLRRFPIAWWFAVCGVAGAAAYLVFSSVSASTAAADRLGGMTDVTVTRVALEPGAVVQPGDTEVVAWPRALLPQAALVAQPVGRVTAVGVAAGTPVSENLLAGSNAGKAAALLHEGERGFTFPRDPFTPNVVVGDHLDLYASVGASETATGSVLVTSGMRTLDVTDDSITVAVPVDDAADVAGAGGKRLTLVVSTAKG